MGDVNLPREPTRGEGINPANIAGAIMGLRFDRITSMKFDIRPSIGIVAKDVDRLGLDIRSFKEPLTRAIKLVIIPSIRKNFQSGGRPAWTPLAEATIIRRGYSAWPILNVTGRLQRRATQFNIWDIGMTSATVRKLPQDAFYGVYHQAGGSANPMATLLENSPRSKVAQALMHKFINKARAELERDVGHVPVGLGTGITEERVRARALGMMMDVQWELPARPFILWQDEDVPKIQQIFIDWMTERAMRSGRFMPE